MRIGILNATKKERSLKDSNALEAQFIAAGHEVIRLYEPWLQFVQQQGNLTVLHGQEPIPELDIIIPRLNFIGPPSVHTQTIELLVQAGYPVLNGRGNYIAAKNKIALQSLLQQAGIPVPPWAIVGTRKGAIRSMEQLGYPVVIKHPFGTWGKGVMYADSPETAAPIVDYLLVEHDHPVLIQKYVGYKQDIRVLVIDDKVIGAISRRAPDDDIRTNTAGNVAEVTELTDEEKELARRATSALNLEMAGVDLMRTDDGPVIIEVNANPGLRRMLPLMEDRILNAFLAYLKTTA